MNQLPVISSLLTKCKVDWSEDTIYSYVLDKNIFRKKNYDVSSDAFNWATKLINDHQFGPQAKDILLSLTDHLKTHHYVRDVIVVFIANLYSTVGYRLVRVLNSDKYDDDNTDDDKLIFYFIRDVVYELVVRQYFDCIDNYDLESIVGTSEDDLEYNVIVVDWPYNRPNIDNKSNDRLYSRKFYYSDYTFENCDIKKEDEYLYII
jgi:hypothetical protein